MKQEELKITPPLFSFDDEEIGKHPNILIASGLWDQDRFEAAKICYKFMRTIDDLVDDHKATNTNFSAYEKKAYTQQIIEWVSCLNGKPVNDPFLEEVVETIEHFKIPVHLFQSFANSMIYDINNDGFPTYYSFLEYAEGASVSPASIFVHLCCLNDQLSGYVYPDMNLLATARPCAIFSYIVHIIRDFEKDFKDNLIYFPKDLLDQFKLSKKDLHNVAYDIRISPGFRKLVTQYCSMAEKYSLQTLDEINRLSAFLKPKYLLSLQVIYELYHLVFERIKRNPETFSGNELNPKPGEIIDHVKKLTSTQSV